MSKPERVHPMSQPTHTDSVPELNIAMRILLALSAFTAAGLMVALIEILSLAWTGQGAPAFAAIGAGSYLWGVIIVGVLAAVLNLLPVAVGVVLGSRATASHPRRRRGLALLSAAVFAAFWHATAMQGDGIQAHDWYHAIYGGSLLAMTGGLMGFVHLLILPGRIPLNSRRRLVGATLVCALLFSSAVLPGYVAFHGYLVAFELMLIAWLIYPWLASRRTQALVAAPVVVGLLSVGAFLAWEGPNLRYVHRYSHLPRSLSLGFAPSRALLTRQVDIFGQATSTKALRDTPPDELQRAGATIDDAPRGQNVLMVVLESTRADAWGDEKITPRFHRWKRHGVYFPRAVANYPATPLAYGALFTAQPPSVLVQTPRWAEHRLFDVAHQNFAHFLLSQPRVNWFEHTAITQFFIPDGVQPHQHADAEEGLAYLRRGIEQAGDAPFFGWVHLYEPHAPYEHREGYGEPGGPIDAYASELRYVDQQLGEFMDWFYGQPVSDDTLVVVIGDHGEGLGDPVDSLSFWGHHVQVHNVVTHVPAYFSGPGIPADSTRPGLDIAQLDVMPTVLDFIGAEPAEGTYPQGWSLYALLDHKPVRPLVTQAFSIRGNRFFDVIGKVRARGEDADVDRFETVLNAGRYSPKIALQYRPWKLHYDATLDRFALYHIEDDPHEQHDLADFHPAELAAMIERLRAWHYRQRWVVDAFESEASPP